ncbi:MAG TPA: ATP-dependent DNA helicase RecG [Terriglobales bacterium]|nr:ATP-dependent DNA helicase RecG [Terriglobales bacterium]
MLELSTPVQYVKGIGPRIAEALAAKGISTVEDLLYYLPFRYEDRLNPRGIAELRPGEMATIIAEVRTFGLFYARNARFWIANLTVGQGRDALTCIWFRAEYLRDRFKPGQLVALYGKVEQKKKGRGLQIVQPQFEIIGEPPGPGEEPDPEELAAQSLEVGRIVPIYEAIGKLTTRWFRRVVHGALAALAPEVPDGLPPAIIARHRLAPRRQAFQGVHFPEAGEAFADLQNARTPAHQRLIYEELFFLEVGLELKRRRLRQQPGISFQLNEKVREAIKKVLPFHPTNAQKKVLREIAEDMARPSPMRRLLQGDVGSGKTIVALEAAIIAIENGYQAALMAPTEILAAQHYISARQILENAGYRMVLLSGSMEDDRKRDTRRHIARGDVHLVIGTHALIQEKVDFAKLGLVIVDEQHRFGVMQRFKLMKKGELDPDVLVMTATPIPRTLALTLYGDLDVSVLDELPPGRTPIVTRRVTDERAGEVWDFARKQVARGRQAFVVYPVIEESKQDEPALVLQPDLLEVKPAAELKAAVKMYDELRKKVFPDLRVGLLHGRLDPEEKERVMAQFKKGEIDVLVSTTVIEVGVDVPNASVMVVEHAERFGLAQLHQLRGRIGRGAARSYCILMTGPKVSPEGERRLDTMVRTTDGFEIAEVDLALRGPGELAGTRQAGMPEFRIANLVRDRELLELAKRDAAALVNGSDPQISADDKARAMAHLKAHWQRRYGLVEVG